MRLLLAVALLALAPATATAKGISGVTVCGADDCRSARGSMALAEGAGQIARPDGRRAFYRVEMHVEHDGEDLGGFEVIVVPEAKAQMGADGTWMPLDQRQLRLYRRLTRGIEPFPAARMPLGRDFAPVARVDAVYPPPAEPAGGGFPWWVLLPLAGVLLALARTGPGSRFLRGRRFLFLRRPLIRQRPPA